jgi:hypothetical protein
VERYVPAPPNPHRLVKPQSQPYRISVHCVKGLPTTLPSSSGNGSSSPRKGAAAAAAGGGGGAALPGMPGSSYEFQLGVSLYDESLGAFYGATCYSGTHQALSVPGAPGAAQQGLAGPGGAAGGHLSVDFGFEAFFHSRIADPQCMAVVSLAAGGRGRYVHTARSCRRMHLWWLICCALADTSIATVDVIAPLEHLHDKVMVQNPLCGTQQQTRPQTLTC